MYLPTYVICAQCMCLMPSDARREGIRASGKGVREGCEPPCWVLGDEPHLIKYRKSSSSLS